MRVREKDSQPLERDFYFLSFHSPLTSINPQDFQTLMEVKLRIEAWRLQKTTKTRRPLGQSGEVMHLALGSALQLNTNELILSPECFPAPPLMD
ncbi:hypothetical protein NQZ68_023324 [Dissostichus eleginoides]|nr:hypothetical protein NQZ68_023324 [Dissostichus eleginoides]